MEAAPRIPGDGFESRADRAERGGGADVAASLKDGRWASQQRRMREHSARHFGGGARLEYLIEADEARETQQRADQIEGEVLDTLAKLVKRK